ncbi:MAG: asparagine synthase (glutamine-hydrolyzing) [Burkholderiaceae bacterium]|nr:asparagine synthase (glutamine-hydrolyzing) [Burkholderiaceae bacterium]
MCGWISIVGRHGQSAPQDGLRRAMGALLHRGPDDAGEFFAGAVALGFRRLSIIDLGAGGHQPMTSLDGDLTLVFNGEIYNYRELRVELSAAGHSFQSRSDTEVLLTAYRHWGRECVQRLNGMFAFVIHDRRDGSLFGARDRLGVKPLYLWQDADWIVLASEPAAIAATGLYAMQPDWPRAASALLWNLMDDNAGTCLAGIRQLPAGHTLSLHAHSGLQERRYWSLPEAPEGPVPGSDEEWVEQLAALVSDAVRLRLRSDVPVGFTLSGGIDSSLLICEAAQQGAGGCELLAFSYQDSHYDERVPIADTVARSNATLHTLHGDRLDVAALLPRVVAANGEPVHSLSAVANYALFGLAREHGVKVLLGGQAADEIFAGYRNFQADYWHTLIGDRQWSAWLADVRASAGVHGHTVARTLLSTAYRSLRIGLSGSALYRRLRSQRARWSANTGHAVFSHEFMQQAAAPVLAAHEQRMDPAQRRAVAIWPLPMYLRIEDRVSMAHSVEARLPFTDYRLVEHALRMPHRLRFAKGVNKVALRQVAARRVPPSVSARAQKYGFPVGHSSATATGLQALCRQLASTRAFRERGIYDPEAVGRLLAGPAGADDADSLFTLAQTELWLSGLENSRGTTAR